MNICQHGECHALNEAPGYHCDCAKGYYGEVCQHFDPCSLEPCNNFGACTNITSRQWRCDCLPGFSGQNCSEFNPCALRPSPCLHGGRCESAPSHKYQCHCTRGHYGKTCQYFDPCSTEPCKNGGKCQNVTEAEFVCKCAPGFTGKQCEVDIDECASSPCKHGATCRDGINSFHCRCAPGYRGKRCHLVEHCPSQTIPSSKGLFRWNATSHGRVHLIECPFGAVFHDRESSNTGFAKRRCYLLSNGSVAWGRPDSTSCREEGYKNAEELTGQLWMLTEDPRHLNIDRMQEATRRIEGVLEYALHDKKIAHNMLSIVSNMLAINESLLRLGDTNGSTVNRVTSLVDRFVSEVKLERGESLSLETENLVVKAVDWDPDAAPAGEELTFPVQYRKRERNTGQRRRTVPFWDDENLDEENDSELSIPMEALMMAQNQSDQELRIKFVAYKNDKFFREKLTTRWRQCESDFGQRYNCLRTETTSYPGRRVLQASISNASISNLSEPLMYVLPSSANIRVFCAYWKEDERVWSTDGLTTNQSNNATTCFSTHMTSFSLLLDPTPHLRISPDHIFNLSIITYVGCGLSMLGLTLTIITYSLFRCLNRDHPGQILLHLCVSMLLMNAAFLGGGSRLGGTHAEICAAVAVLIHYFLLTSLSWMCVEATNMYQLLVHVFATSESHFMLKRAILAWGIPFIIVGVTVIMDWEVYYQENEYCMLSAKDPYVYYFSFLGPCCLILTVNLIVFLMVTRVLFTPRAAAQKKQPQGKKEKILVTTAQVRGAFTVMVLLGVSWVFGAFAVGEARLVFQYIFCVANSLQGFLIFVVRCLQYQEARSAWCQLVKTGTFKKYRGMVPPGSWSGNSNSGHTKQNGHSTTTRLGSMDAGIPFSTNTYWGPEKGAIPCNEEVPALVASDYASRGQLLTFSSSNTLKSNSSRDADTARRPSKQKTLSRSNSETSQDHSKVSEEPPVRDTSANHYMFGLSPSVLIETTDAENGEEITPHEAALQTLKDPQLSSLPTEPKSRSSYASSIGFIDEENGDKMAANTLDRKIFASKASSVFGNVKGESPPDFDKQNSWPRTLSSFLGGKEPLKFTISDSNNGSLPLSSKRYNSVQDYPSTQVIPLHVRPTSPSFLRDSDSFLRTTDPSSDHPLHHHVPAVGRSWRTTSLDVTEEDESTVDCATDAEAWNVQGVVSPNESTMFIDSAASRL